MSTLGCSSTHAMQAHMHCSTPLGRCMGCCWMQDGRKCRSSMAACLHGRKCQNLVAVCACCCLCSTTHSCASKSVMVHTHFGMPSRACVSISNKAQQCQIKLKNKAQTKEGGRVDLRGLGPPWKEKVGFEALARAKICMPARTQLKGLPGSTACRCVSPFSGHRM